MYLLIRVVIQLTKWRGWGFTRCKFQVQIYISHLESKTS